MSAERFAIFSTEARRAVVWSQELARASFSPKTRGVDLLAALVALPGCEAHAVLAPVEGEIADLHSRRRGRAWPWRGSLPSTLPTAGDLRPVLEWAARTPRDGGAATTGSLLLGLAAHTSTSVGAWLSDHDLRQPRILELLPPAREQIPDPTGPPP